MSNNHIVYTSDEITNLSKQKIWENNIINSPLKKIFRKQNILFILLETPI